MADPNFKPVVNAILSAGVRALSLNSRRFTFKNAKLENIPQWDSIINQVQSKSSYQFMLHQFTKDSITFRIDK